MALPAHVLERLPPALVRGSSLITGHEAAQGLALGVPALDAALPDAGVLRGGIVELAVSGSSSCATAIALLTCRAAQREGQSRGGEAPWCAFIDPTSSLYGPGVAQVGVDLERLLVVRPGVEALARVALRLVESRIFAVTVIDTLGVPGCELEAALGTWPRVLRRMSLALEGSQSAVLFITDNNAPRPLPLPVAMRLELNRVAEHELVLQVAKDKRGRISRPRSIAWGRPRTIEGKDGLARSA